MQYSPHQCIINRMLLSLPAVVYVATAAVLAFRIVQQTGHMIYPIDDPYIHLAMARHWAEDGFFGVSLYGFSASSSAPGWTLFLGLLFYGLGNHEWLPFAVNAVAGLCLVIWLTGWLQHHWQSPTLSAGIGIGLIFVIPLPAVVFLGMEHTLHGLFVLLMLHRGVGLIQRGRDRWDIWLLLWGLLDASCRYETVFAALPLAVLFAARKNWRLALLTILGPAAVIGLTGAVQLAQGWYFLPNAVLQKSMLSLSGWQRINQTLERWFGQLFHTAHVFTPFLLLLLAWLQTVRQQAAFTSPRGAAAFVALGAIVLHTGFASLGWFYRYEAYLLVLAAYALAYWAETAKRTVRAMWRYGENRFERAVCRAVCLAGLGLLPVLFSVNLASISRIVPGARNLYNQQYQMGVFLQEHYEGHVVAANDIGAINYLADIYCLDLMGLGSLTPLQARMHQRYNKPAIATWCEQQQAAIAVVYESWWGENLPETWRKAGEWIVPKKVTVADQTVSFFAVQPSEMGALVNNLRRFSSQLPQGVAWQLAKRLSTSNSPQ